MAASPGTSGTTSIRPRTAGLRVETKGTGGVDVGPSGLARLQVVFEVCSWMITLRRSDISVSESVC